MDNDSELENKEMFDYFHMNYQSLFELEPVDLSKLSSLAILRKESHQKHFQSRLNTYADNFSKGDFTLGTYLKGWDTDYLRQLVEDYGGLLFGLFHFGAHRHVLLDSAGINIPVVAPIAGQSYYDLQKLMSFSSEEKANRVQLIEVEGEKVSRELFKALRKGRVGGIYVDGNMGPTDNQKSGNGVKIDFFQHKLSVKAGIARLSLLLKLPILPVFCINNHGVDEIQFGKLIGPVAKDTDKNEFCISVMQKLYKELEIRVKKSPSDWEYALCLHRWITTLKKESVHKAKELPIAFDTITLRHSFVSEISKDDSYFWINTSLSKGFKIPNTLSFIFKELYEKKILSWQQFSEAVEQNKFSGKELLIQLLHNELVEVR